MIDPIVKPWHFGYLWQQDTFYGKKHAGTDFIAPTGTALFACHDGRVSQSYKSKTFGEAIRLAGNPYETLYAHLSQRLVKVSQEVKEGDLIGYSGSTGTSTGPHLHLELKVNGKLVDPLSVLEENVTNDELNTARVSTVSELSLDRTLTPEDNDAINGRKKILTDKLANGVAVNDALNQLEEDIAKNASQVDKPRLKARYEHLLSLVQ